MTWVVASLTWRFRIPAARSHEQASTAAAIDARSRLL